MDIIKLTSILRDRLEIIQQLFKQGDDKIALWELGKLHEAVIYIKVAAEEKKEE